MFKNETGLKVYEAGDEVQLGKGKVLYNVVEDLGAEGVLIRSQNTGRETPVETARVNLVTNVRATQFWDGTVQAPFDTAARTVAFAEAIKQPTNDLYSDEDEWVQDHQPGESPAQYQARTGLRLDGRTTSYGRLILAALQRKALVFSGARSKNRSKRTERARTHLRGARRK
jgi:hypothetical protein